MKPNVEALKELLNNEFKGNQSNMARAFDVSKEHVNSVINYEGKGGGAIFCGGIMKYCEKNKLDYKKYIILD